MDRVTPSAKFIVLLSSLKDKPYVYVYHVGNVFEAWTANEYEGVQQHYADYASIEDAIEGTSLIT